MSEDKKLCCIKHPMYDKLVCTKSEGHDGLHSARHEYDVLRWGVPSYEEMYTAIRTK